MKQWNCREIVTAGTASGAKFGNMPDAAMRRRMAEYFASL